MCWGEAPSRSPSTACGRPPWPLRALTVRPVPLFPPLLCVSVSCSMGQLGSGAVRLGPASPWHLFWGEVRPSFVGPPCTTPPGASTRARHHTWAQARVPYSIDDSDRRPAALHMWAACPPPNCRSALLLILLEEGVLVVAQLTVNIAQVLVSRGRRRLDQ